MQRSGQLLVLCVGLSLAAGAFAQVARPGVVDLRDRAFTSQEVVDALVKPAEPAQPSAPARKKRGLAVVASGGEASAESDPAQRRALSIQLQFEFDSAQLTGDALVKLDAVGSALQSAALRAARFHVSGHTDAAGKPDYNLILSKRRAEAVRAYLIARHGVDSGRIVATGRGADELLDAADPRGAANRRVQFETLD
jgi:outer membrane protein OmpA-like peptidoglycan-associated protein